MPTSPNFPQKKFVLTRKNQKGQVAIFVALIFQVVFVFFAILINVGLLVHHKINLQQSTDLAAYYGAMKQAEIMNAISHVNFQMRQAWKLLTWRYRIVGTFAFQQSERGVPQITFPLSLSRSALPTTYNGGAAESTMCAPYNVNILDLPFFCGGHSGYRSWPTAVENNCKVDCGHINGMASAITAIPLTGGFDSSQSGGVAGSVNAALDKANENIRFLCEGLGPSGFQLVAKYILAYGAEIQQKKHLIQMLGADLSADVDSAVDLDGGLIKAGSKLTFLNNLTEANSTGNPTLTTMNGLRAPGDCAFQGDSSDGTEGSNRFLTEIKIQVVQFFIHQCSGQKNTDKEFQPTSIYSDLTFTDIAPSLFPRTMPTSERNRIRDAVLGTKFIVGYEKNPWCQVYYGAKAQAEPKIPFLPMAKIKLSAVAFAKPFGGSIGPRYNSVWSSATNATSDSGPRVDDTLPMRKLNGVASVPPLIQAQTMLLNYSNKVGDTKGLKDAEVVAAYQDMLLFRPFYVGAQDINTLNISVKKSPSPAADNKGIQHPQVWPDFSNWNNLSDPTKNDYDYLAMDGGNNSYLRDIELSVVAPNQFDLTYFSIDPDYYNNYYAKLKNSSGSYGKILAAAKNNGPTIDEIKPDYGFNQILESNNSIAKGFSVRHQIAVASRIIKNARHMSGNFLIENKDIFKFIPNAQASLLTGWTFENFSNYGADGSFPSAGPDGSHTMTFGKCNDGSWNQTGDSDIEKAFDSPVSKSLPPTPGNCVTGGRTGYSVKLISPSLIRSGAPPQAYGGGGSTGPIRNPTDDNFFTF